MPELPNTTNTWRVRSGQAEPERKRIAIPDVAPTNLLVRIQAHGVCHSDCAIRDTLKHGHTAHLGWPDEFTLGHEGAGEIVKLGSHVDDTVFEIGDRVALHVVPGCNECVVCKQGHHRICKAENNGGYGLGRDGFFQEYVSVRADAAVKVPQGVSIEQAAIAPDAVLTAYHAVKYTADVKPDQTIAIFGLGGVGLNALQTALHIGVKRILVCDKRQDAVDIAIRLGIPREDAICTGGADAKPAHQVVAERGIIVDTVIDFVGHEDTIASGLLLVRPAGLVVMVGLLSSQITLTPLLIVSKMLTIKGSFSGTVEGLKECLDLLAKGVLRPEIETASIEDLPQVMRDLDEGKYQGRKVLLPDWKDDVVTA